jgi:hypothetical protein
MVTGITRLELSDGQWVDAKDSLKMRDKRDQHSYSVDGMSTDGTTYRFNVVKHTIATAAIRILNWSLKATDDFGKPVRFPSGKSFKDRVEAIESLDEDTFEAISKAIQEHEKALTEASEAAKKLTPTGATDSTATSPSAS